MLVDGQLAALGTCLLNAGECLARILRRREINYRAMGRRWGSGDRELDRLCNQLAAWQLDSSGLTVESWDTLMRECATGLASLSRAEDLHTVQTVGRALRGEV